jgi:hypothetical protein
LSGDLDLEQAFEVHRHVRELPGGPRQVKASSSSQAVLRAELEAAMANYADRLHSAHPPPRRSPIVPTTYLSLMMTGSMKTQRPSGQAGQLGDDNVSVGRVPVSHTHIVCRAGGTGGR